MRSRNRFWLLGLTLFYSGLASAFLFYVATLVVGFVGFDAVIMFALVFAVVFALAVRYMWRLDMTLDYVRRTRSDSAFHSSAAE